MAELMELDVLIQSTAATTAGLPRYKEIEDPVKRAEIEKVAEELAIYRNKLYDTDLSLIDFDEGIAYLQAIRKKYSDD